MKIHPALTYTAGRTALMAAVAAALFAVGFRSWALVLLAIVISMPLSWFVLRRQREQLAERVAAHQQRRQQERAALRAVLDEQDLDQQDLDEQDLDEPATNQTATKNPGGLAAS